MSSPRIIGYFAGWRNGANGQPAYLVPDLPWDRLTHVNYAFAHLLNRYQAQHPDAGHQWRARWWTQANEPGTHEVWTDLGACQRKELPR